MSIGNNIKNLRLNRGLSQQQLGEIVGATDKAVSTWENNISIPRMGTIEKMANYFGVLKSDIIEGNAQTQTIPFNDFTYALYNETKELTDKQKQAILDMAKAFKDSQK